MAIRPTVVRLLATLAPAVLLLPASAHAEQVVTEDAVGDAEASTYHQDFQFVPAPQEAATDITRTVVSLSDRRLRVRVELHDLRVRPHHGVVVRFRTPHAVFDVFADREGASRARFELSNPRDEVFECRGLWGRYDGAADAISVSVPTRCIGSPRWVRLGVKVTASPAVEPDPQTAVVFYTDDALRDGNADRTVRLGPRIHRG